MAPKDQRKNLYRDMLYIRLKGPGTVMFFSLWSAEFRAIVTSECGQTQYDGYTMI